MRPDDRFRIGSVTKTFLATIVLQLAGERRLHLDDKVARWFPGLVPYARAITVRELLNHTSGLFDYLGDPALAVRLSKHPQLVLSPRRKIAIAASHPLLFRPGAGWRYSNTNYLVLGVIVEKVTGHTVEQELERRIFEPLGLDHTTFAGDGPRNDVKRARGYDLIHDRPRDATLDTLAGPGADGAIVSNTDDIARFFGALLSGQLLRKDLLHAMETTVPTGSVGADGLGLFRHPTYCGDGWGHTGGTSGYLFSVLASRNGKRIAIVAANGSSPERAGGLIGTGDLSYCSH